MFTSVQVNQNQLDLQVDSLYVNGMSVLCAEHLVAQLQAGIVAAKVLKGGDRVKMVWEGKMGTEEFIVADAALQKILRKRYMDSTSREEIFLVGVKSGSTYSQMPENLVKV